MFIKDHRKEFSVERMAKVLDVSTSGYYGWFSRPESGREQERLLLDVLVKAAYEASRCRYGSLKISRALAEQGKQYRRNRVADSMRRQGLRSKVRRKFVVTTDTKPLTWIVPTKCGSAISRICPVDRDGCIWLYSLTYFRVAWLAGASAPRWRTKR